MIPPRPLPVPGSPNVLLVYSLLTAAGGSAAPPGASVEAGARVFLRPEARVNEEFQPTLVDDSWRVRQAARLYVHGFWGPASVRASLQHVMDWGGADTPSSGQTNRTGLFQGYLDLSGERGKASGFIRLGRQWFGIGSQRLLAYRYWQPGNLSIDALRMEGTLGRVTVGGFGSVLAPASTFTVDDPADPANPREIQSEGHFFGAGYVNVAVHRAATVEAQAWGWSEGPIESDPARDRRYGNFGGRVHGEPVTGLRYAAEGYYQTGRLDGRDHRAWSLIGLLGYQAPRPAARPGLRLTYEVHSGERCRNESDDPAGCGAGTSRDFQRMLGIGHRDRGHMDLVGPRNNRTLTVGTSIEPHDSTRMSLDYHFFQLHRADGKWALNNGAPVGSGWDRNNRAHDLGHEIDVNILFRPLKVLSLRPAYGVFIPDAAARRIAGPAPQHFVYLWIIAEIGHRW